MYAPVAAVSCLTEVKEPRRIAWRVMSEKKHSTRLIQEHPVGVKCRVTRSAALAGEPRSRARLSSFARSASGTFRDAHAIGHAPLSHVPAET
jgi:hypothetical protein